MGIAFNSMRVGKRYRLINHREVFDFELMEVVSKTEFRLKDIHTLEEYFMSDLIRFGRGKDFAIFER
jgi:hypothetical protein